MRQNLSSDSVDLYIAASPERLYDVVSDVSRTPELTPDIVRCQWVRGETGPRVGARFTATNKIGRGPRLRNRPTVITADPGREFAFSRTAPFAGTIEWRYRFLSEGAGTRVTESYTVTKPISSVGWFVLGTMKGLHDRRTQLRQSMQLTLRLLAAITEP